MLWHNSVRHDGMILCGCPFEGVLTLDDSDNMDLGSAIPIGPAFIDTCLARYKDKITRLTDTIVDIPSVCSPGRLAIRSANLMPRHCCKVTHLALVSGQLFNSLDASLLYVSKVVSIDLFCSQIVHFRTMEYIRSI